MPLNLKMPKAWHGQTLNENCCIIIFTYEGVTWWLKIPLTSRS